MPEDNRKKNAPGRKQGVMIADLTERMDTAEAWYAAHDKDCAQFRREIKDTTGKILDLQTHQGKQLNTQDETLAILRTGKHWWATGKKGVLALIAVAGFWSGLVKLFDLILAHIK